MSNEQKLQRYAVRSTDVLVPLEVFESDYGAWVKADEALKQLAEREPIPTTTRLPEVGERVLILIVHSNETRQWEFGKLETGAKVTWRWRTERIGIMPFESVSHWTPLPPPSAPEGKHD